MAEHNHPPRWYCVSREGVATLCVDEEDAKANAAHCDLAWPNGGPHRAVQLVDVAAVVAERERWMKHHHAVTAELLSRHKLLREDYERETGRMLPEEE